MDETTDRPTLGTHLGWLVNDMDRKRAQTFVLTACRECGQTSYAAHTDDTDNPDHAWDRTHHDRTGHVKIAVWKLEYMPGQYEGTLSAPLFIPPRRKLGHR